MELIGWQICRPQDDDGQGKACAKDDGGWSTPGRAMAYLSEHPALAMLEARVNLDIPHEEMAHDHLLLRVHLPSHSLEELGAMPDDPVAHGEAWLREGRSAMLLVPSIVVQEGRNLLLNPEHPVGREARVITATPFRFDKRLWGGS